MTPMKPGHSTPAPDDVCRRCGKTYKDYHGPMDVCHDNGDRVISYFAPVVSPAPGVAATSDLKTVHPEPEEMVSKLIDMTKSKWEANQTNWDKLRGWVNDRITDDIASLILAKMDELSEPVSRVAATTAKSTLSVFQQIEHEAESTGNELFDGWREKDERAHYVMGFKDGGRFASKLFDSPAEQEGELAALKALLADSLGHFDALLLTGDVKVGFADFIIKLRAALGR